MNYNSKVSTLIHAVFEKLQISPAPTQAEIEKLLETPKESKMGDVAFPCFSLAKALRKAPPLIAKELHAAIATVAAQPEFATSIAKVEAAGPYLNFFINKAELAGTLIPQILSGEFLSRRASKNQKVMIEYSQPNTHKAFHVGHTRNVSLGDSLTRMYEWAGYDVIAANYIGDEGAHIAKCLWYYEKYFKGDVPNSNLGEFLGILYSKADTLLDFTTLTKTPVIGVLSAKVENITDHPTKKEWKVATVSTGKSTFKVVCGGVGYKVGDIVAYATVGSRPTGRLVEKTDKAGITSEGMILSEAELCLSEEKNKIFVLPAGTNLGLELAEIMRQPESSSGALAANQSVIAEIKKREQEVADVLKDLEACREPRFALWQKTKKWSMDEFYSIYKWLDARFDHFFFESEVGDSGKHIVLDLYEKGILIKSEGAIGADLSKFNLPFFLLLRSNGTGMYSTKDISLAKKKFDEFKIDRSIYVVDVAQSLHFQQVFKTLELMGYEKAKLCYHLAYGMVVLPDGKMSSRKGNVILFSQLKETLIKKINEEFLSKYTNEWPKEELEEAAKRIAIATIKYGMLNQDNQKNIVFDLNDWTARTGNTGPYLMYAYTRTRSILRELQSAGFDYASLRSRNGSTISFATLTHDTEKDLLSRLANFHEVATYAAESYQPQQLCIYLYDLSKDFSRMYQVCSVLKAESPELQMARAALVDATGLVLQRGLSLLGIKTLERM